MSAPTAVTFDLFGVTRVALRGFGTSFRDALTWKDATGTPPTSTSVAPVKPEPMMSIVLPPSALPNPETAVTAGP